jgi:hypothetical protein
MSYTVEKLANEPITIYTALDFDINELPKSDKALLDLLSKQTELVYHIMDMGSLKLNLDELIQVAGHVAFGKDATFRHPLFTKTVRELLLITADPTLALSGEALSSDIYGNIPVRVFNSREAALRYIRGKIKED